ncbi:MAG: hypothetical protein WA139_03070 [Candidatus Aenigmatarchaeota archaeon]
MCKECGVTLNEYEEALRTIERVKPNLLEMSDTARAADTNLQLLQKQHMSHITTKDNFSFFTFFQEGPKPVPTRQITESWRARAPNSHISRCISQRDGNEQIDFLKWVIFRLFNDERIFDLAS